MLLQCLSRHVQRQVVRIHNTTDKRQVVWHHVLLEKIEQIMKSKTLKLKLSQVQRKYRKI